jgi:archaellum biogenesis protein FlaJ (TadC family)
MTETTKQRHAATIAVLTGVIGVIVGLTLASLAGCGWRAETAIAIACGLAGLVLGGAVGR